MNKLLWGIACAAAFGCGCSGDRPPADGNAALGIASFEVTKTGAGVTVVGLDADHAPIGRLQMTFGPFTMSDDWAEGRTGAERNVVGFSLDIEFRGVKTHHESAGLGPLALPLLPGKPFAKMQAFLDDPHVYQELAPWGVEFAHQDAATASGGEVAYDITDTQCGGTCGGTPCGTNTYSYQQAPVQYCGGGSTNACSGATAHVMPSSTVGDCDNSTYPNQSYVSLCCSDSSYNTVNAAIKACVPTAYGQTACNAGGMAGCAVCWSTGFGWLNVCIGSYYQNGQCDGTHNGVVVDANWCDPPDYTTCSY